ncbi:hypothetical protein DYB36_008741 [Aphanomyces astaci]|uniref:Peptidase S1 domain-containing protein n=1 Tax=Aphanomyces astaci TaxID=112090 RepID=A0A397AQC0_APHAT|nr:hypothetical protein DYB36_008741 [Aphanomyces astaci]
MHVLLWTAVAAAMGVVDAYVAPFQESILSPYMSQLRWSVNNPMICQGVLVGPTFVLVTRACADIDNGVAANTVGASKLVVGATYMDRGLDDGEWIPVLKKHYSTNATVEFAMIELARPSKSPPVRILWDDVMPGSLVWLRGWFPLIQHEPLNTLKAITVQILANDKCEALLNRRMYEYQVCADNDNINFCTWRIYGSLLIEIDGSDYLVGMASFASCVVTPTWQRFNRVSAGRSFIEPFLCNGT